MMLPISRSLLAAMEATLAMSALPLIGLDCLLRFSMTASTALRMPRARAMASAPAVEVAVAFLENRLGQNRRGGGAVAGDIAGLAGGFLHQLGADVFVFVLQFDFLRDGDAVLGDGWMPPALCR